MGALLAARECGIQVPEELSIIGVDGHEISELVGLTTMSQPVVAQGATAAALVLDLIAGRPRTGTSCSMPSWSSGGRRGPRARVCSAWADLACNEEAT